MIPLYQVAIIFSSLGAVTSSLICSSFTCCASTTKVQTALHSRSHWSQQASAKLNNVFYTVADDIQGSCIGQPLSCKCQSTNLFGPPTKVSPASHLSWEIAWVHVPTSNGGSEGWVDPNQEENPILEL